MKPVDDTARWGFDPGRADQARSLRADLEPKGPPPVSPEVAPLWNELLPRLDDVVGRPTPPLLPEPPDPALADPVRRARALRAAASHLESLAAQRPDNDALRGLARVVSEHVALTTELALRCRG